MKNLGIVLILALLSQKAQSQFSVDAGRNITVCADKFRKVDSIQLIPLTSGSVGTIDFIWNFKFDIGLGNYVYGSNILDDTTNQNPRIVNASALPNNTWLPIYLTITDSVGNKATDSLMIRFSRFSSLADFTDRTLAPNTYIQIYPLSGLGIPPLKYKWFPNYNIDDTSFKEPFVHPGKTTTYICQVTDSIGCKSDWYDQWNIYVDSTLSIIEETNHINAQIFPNPITSHSILKFDNSTGDEYVIDVFDIQGKNTYHSTQIANTILLGDLSFTKGCSIITILKKKQLLYKAKLIVE